MNEKICRHSVLSLAVVSALAVGAALLPDATALAKSSRSAPSGARANAIIGTGADAIIGTGADAIIGTGADAIIGTGADAIIGTGLQKAGRGKGNAIIGTGADAIIGTGADAIIGTGADAIIGTGADAIIGTGADAIIGTGLQKAGGAFLALMGPVDKVDRASGTVTVLNRRIRVPATSGLIDYLQQSAASGNSVELAIYARVDAAGILSSATARVLPGQYVAGVSKVVVSGMVSSIDAGTATAVVRGTVVNYSSLLSTTQVHLAAGDVVTFVGTLPQSGEQMLAAALVKRGQ
jgi:hypothetical protein